MLDPKWPKWVVEKAKARRKDWLRWRFRNQHPAAVELMSETMAKEIWDMAVITTLDLLKKEGRLAECSVAGDYCVSLSIRMHEQRQRNLGG